MRRRSLTPGRAGGCGIRRWPARASSSSAWTPAPPAARGPISAWTAYKHLGVQELEDIKTAINWLKQKPYVDGSRIGMAGHSYGGYITAYAMTHSDLFAAGIAGAPVTDWRDYDSIYTERYMGLPQDNPDGYNVSSVVRAAGQAARQAADPSRRDRRQRLAAKHDEVRRGPSRRQQGLRADDLSVVAPRHLRAALQQAAARLHPANPGRPESRRNRFRRARWPRARRKRRHGLPARRRARRRRSERSRAIWAVGRRAAQACSAQRTDGSDEPDASRTIGSPCPDGRGSIEWVPG